MKKSKVVISGYYGFDNTGDEAVLYSMIRQLRELVPELEITVLSHRPEKTMASHDVRAVNRWSLLQVIRAVSRADLVLSGGGSLLQDVTGIKSLLYYLGVIAVARLLGKRVMIYAQGIGPINTLPGKWLTRLAVNRVDLITVRDEESGLFLKQLGVTRPSIKVTADPVLGLDSDRIQSVSFAGLFPNLMEKGAPLAGISVRKWKGWEEARLIFARVGDRLVERGWKVIFLPMHFPEDLNACRETASLMKEDSAILEQQPSVETLLGIMQGMDLVIGMRLHALILAAVARVPIIGVSYDPKIDSFIKMTGQINAGRVEEITPEQLVKAVEWGLDRREELKERLEHVLPDLRYRARENTRQAVRLLTGR
ncbi:polysaccharide pyruvyl transferase CsaB [Calderihabitans maritimus]|uniref:Polysaccharide pyruvyl transferase n=1 Tax=Calderihabitans maritimus TaxID=1246530 RepID=A0A1Z5HUV2_9FIRM|nr:polysaccharide pyruvyl transferase CsaB [Calderihabitans maritimus]GAW93127.1 polysaccharide pyruvyl transferase [Calderihabitans maritimus]